MILRFLICICLVQDTALLFMSWGRKCVMQSNKDLEKRNTELLRMLIASQLAEAALEENINNLIKAHIQLQLDFEKYKIVKGGA